MNDEVKVQDKTEKAPFIERMSARVVALAEWMEYHWIVVVIVMLALIMPWVFLILASWLYGFWANGIYGTKFDLGSCLSAVGVVVTALGGIATLAKAAWTKYDSDSKYNTAEGEAPVKGVIASIKTTISKE